MNTKDLAQRVTNEFPTEIQIEDSGGTLKFYFKPSNNTGNHYNPHNFPLGEISSDGEETLIFNITSYNSSNRSMISSILETGSPNKTKGNSNIGRKLYIHYGELWGKLYYFFKREFNVEQVKKYKYILRNKSQEVK